jgi:hypothetical protein
MRAGLASKNPDAAFVRKEEPEEAAEERGLAGSVRTDEAENDSRRDLEGDVS